MQTLWDFKTFSIGQGTDYFRGYFQNIATWKPLGDTGLRYCTPTKMVDPWKPGDCGVQLSEYFAAATLPSSGHPYAHVTIALSDSAGFKLEFVGEVRCLEIQAGLWTEAAPLPETDPELFTFWYCPVPWDPRWGGNLKVIPKEGDPQEFNYTPCGARGVLIGPGLPHELTPVKRKAKRPYYCLYGQLREVK